MTDTYVLALVWVGGLFAGCIITGLCLADRPVGFLHLIRLPHGLHRKLRKEARLKHVSTARLIVQSATGASNESPHHETANE
jgi:hypothetical protein